MKVAITGAAGYTGGLLLRAHLARGDLVHAHARDASSLMVHPNVRGFAADLAQPPLPSRDFFDGVDVVYHCAAELRDESRMHAVNVEATRALLAVAAGRISHWVQLSSLSVYGTPRRGSITEESPLRPRSVYARTKADADELVTEFAKGGFSYTLVRPAAVVGPRMRAQFMYALIEAVRRGRFCFIGRGGALGNYVHEDDIVDALMLSATRREAQGRVYNVSQNVPLEHLIDAIAEGLRCKAPTCRLPEVIARLAAQLGRVLPRFPLTPSRVDALTSCVAYESKRIESDTGFSHRRSIADAVRQLAAGTSPA